MKFTDRLKLVSESCFTQLKPNDILLPTDWIIYKDGNGRDYASNQNLAGLKLKDIDITGTVLKVLRPKDIKECVRLLKEFEEWENKKSERKMESYLRYTKNKLLGSLGIDTKLLFKEIEHQSPNKCK